MALVVVLWLAKWLHCWEVLEWCLAPITFLIIIKNLLQLLALRIRHLELLARKILEWLLLGVPDVDRLVRAVLWPVVVLLVVDEIVNVQHMPEVDEAICFVCLFGLLLIHRQP